MTRKLAFAVLASVMLAACQKTDPAKSPESLVTKTPAAMIIAAKDFFKNNIATLQSGSASSNTGAFSRQEINKTPLWEKAYITHDKIKGDVVIVPMQYAKPLYIKTNFGNGSTLSIENQSQLWIYTDVSGKYKADVRIELPDKTYQEGSSKSFTGYLLEQDWTGNSIATYLYKNGKVSLLKKNPLPLNSNNTMNREGNICYIVNWYQCDYIANGVGYNCQLLYSEYIPCDSDEDDEEGGGGGGGSQPGTCNTSEWSSAVTGATDLESISTVGEGPETRTKSYVWVFAKGTFNPTLRWKSHETGVHFRDSNEWKWQSLTHNSVSKVGVVIGGSLQCDVNSATPTLGIYNAIMAIDYTFTWSYVCGGSPINGSENKISAKPFNVND